MHFFGGADALRSLMQLVGLILMTMVLFLTVTSTMVFGVQMYFAYRLMTSGPIGFESARAFYLDRDMTYWRQWSVKALVWGLPLLILSTGCMLSVQLAHGTVDKNAQTHIVCDTVACLTFLTFAAFAIWLFRLGLLPQRTFNRKYLTESNV